MKTERYKVEWTEYNDATDDATDEHEMFDTYAEARAFTDALTADPERDIMSEVVLTTERWFVLSDYGGRFRSPVVRDWVVDAAEKYTAECWK